MSAWAKPGVKCVCIAHGWPEHEMEEGGVTRAPMPNEVLTVTEVIRNGYLRFAEIPVVQAAGCELAWDVTAFRPLITRTQEEDLALFRDLLTDAPVEVNA